MAAGLPALTFQPSHSGLASYLVCPGLSTERLAWCTAALGSQHRIERPPGLVRTGPLSAMVCLFGLVGAPLDLAVSTLILLIFQKASITKLFHVA